MSRLVRSHECVELLGSHAGLPQDGTHRSARDFSMIWDDDSSTIFAAELDVTTPPRDLFEAGTPEGCENLAR